MSAAATLLTPEFLRELETLRRRLQIQARSGGPGSASARRRGGAAEFADHRPYAPGDDLRRVDWLAYARTGEPVLKLFRAEEDAVVRLLLDCSGSLDFGTPRKIEVIRRFAAAIGYMALAQGERAQVLLAGSPGPAPTEGSPRAARALSHIGAPRRGRASVPAFLRELLRADAGGSCDLASAIDLTVETSARPGLLLVLSDFLDSGPVMAALSRARARGHEPCLVHVVTREEVSPDQEGDLTLVDAETGATVDVTMDPEAIDAYVLRFVGLVEELRGFTRKHGGTYVRLSNDEPLEAPVRRFVAKSID